MPRFAFVTLTFLLALSLLAACSPAGGESPTAVSGQPASASATPTAEPLPPTAAPTATRPPTAAPVASPTPDLPPSNSSLKPRYTLSAVLDYGWKTLTASERVEIPHPGNGDPSEIVLVVPPNGYPGVFQLDSLAWADGSPVAAYTLDGVRLTIPLDSPWNLDETRTLSMTFTLNLPPVERGEEFGPNPFGYTSRQVNLTDWHPFVPPFIEGEWRVHNPWFYGEYLVYPQADYEVEIRLENAPAGTVIAASGLDTGDEAVHRYRVEAARTFVWSVSPEYRVYRREIGEVTLLGYAFPFDAVGGEAAFEATVEAF